MLYANLSAQDLESGNVIAEFLTAPDRATIILQARQLGCDEELATAAADALLSGDQVAAVFSGKLASGKDTVAAAVSDELSSRSASFEAVIHRTSDPMRAELSQVASLVEEASTSPVAVDSLVSAMSFPRGASQHMVDALWAEVAAGTYNPEARTDLNRHMLQFLADEGRRAVDPDYWVKRCFPAMLETLADGRSAFLSGGRYPNEMGPAQTLGMVTVRLLVSPQAQADRLWGRDNLEPDPRLLEDPNECALDDYAGFNLVVGNEGALEPTVKVVSDRLHEHVRVLATRR